MFSIIKAIRNAGWITSKLFEVASTGKELCLHLSGITLGGMFEPVTAIFNMEKKKRCTSSVGQQRSSYNHTFTEFSNASKASTNIFMLLIKSKVSVFSPSVVVTNEFV